MENDNDLDIDLIKQTCGFGSDVDIGVFIKNLVNLSDNYTDDELIKIYNYLLSTVVEPENLLRLIRFSDKYRDKSSLEPLVNLLVGRRNIKTENTDEDDVANVRIMCAKAIANIKDTSVVGSLLYCLNNKNENYKVRLACADALGKIGDKYAVTPLIDLMQDEDEKSVYLKESAVSALGALGDERAVEPLVSILESKQGFLDKFSFLKERVIEALRKLEIGNNRRIIKALKNSLYDVSPMVRINAIEAIMNSDEDDAYEIIKPSLRDDDEEVRKNALVALYNLSDRTILDEVIGNDEYPEKLREYAKELIDEYETDEEDE